MPRFRFRPKITTSPITAETAPLVVEAGARVLVAGSAVYKGDPAEEMGKILAAGRGALTGSR